MRWHDSAKPEFRFTINGVLNGEEAQTGLDIVFQAVIAYSKLETASIQWGVNHQVI